MTKHHPTPSPARRRRATRGLVAGYLHGLSVRHAAVASAR
jgi:hypothetical protein